MDLSVKSVDVKSVDVKSVGVKSADVGNVNVNNVDVKSVDIKSIDAESVDVKTVDVKSVDVESVEVNTPVWRPAVSSTGVNFKHLEDWYKHYFQQDLGLLAFFEPNASVEDADWDYIDMQKQHANIEEAMANIRITKGFCEDCHQCFAKWPDGSDWKEEHIVKRYGIVDLLAGTRAGCKFCALVYRALWHLGSWTWVSFGRIEQRLKLLNKPFLSTVQVKTCKLYLSPPGLKCTFSVVVGHFEISDYLEWYEEGYESPDLARQWLNKCEKDHDCRSGPENAQPRPTRLLHISKNAIRLVLTKDWDSIPRYATLSYCWGTEGFMKLTDETLSSFLVDIQYRTLPQTFRSAVDIALAFGLENLWIDALCIIQEQASQEDWLKEADRMRSVYGGSYVNLAASDGENVHEGRIYNLTNCRDGLLAPYRLGESKERIMRFYGTSPESLTGESYLATRAWTFQERLLAPRTLYFGTNGLAWECKYDYEFEIPSLFGRHRGKTKALREHHQPWDWTEIVASYSKSDLTYSKDKLIALSGVARRQHELLPPGDVYLAGLWKNDLHSQLTWCQPRVYREENTKSQEAWRAPSWSWASVDGPVEVRPDFRLPHLVKHLQVLDVWTTPAGPDPFGAVTDGKLTVRCAGLIQGLRRGAWDVEWESDKLASRKTRRPGPCYWADMDQNGDHIETGDGVVFALHVMANGDEASAMTYGLILQQSGTKRGIFQRVGMFEHRKCPPSASSDAAESITALHKNLAALTAEKVCSGVGSYAEYPEQKYTIHII